MPYQRSARYTADEHLDLVRAPFGRRKHVLLSRSRRQGLNFGRRWRPAIVLRKIDCYQMWVLWW